MFQAGCSSQKVFTDGEPWLPFGTFFETKLLWTPSKNPKPVICMWTGVVKLNGISGPKFVVPGNVRARVLLFTQKNTHQFHYSLSIYIFKPLERLKNRLADSLLRLNNSLPRLMHAGRILN